MGRTANRLGARPGCLFLIAAGLVAGVSFASIAIAPWSSIVALDAGDGGRVSSTEVFPRAAAYSPHPPILIDGDAGFTAANGVTRGSGTPSDPYVIEGWEIDASIATGISIANTLAHAVIRNVSVSGGDLIYDGVLLDTVANIVVEGGVFVGNGYGIVAYASSAVTIANNEIANSLWEGILVDSSSSVSVIGNDALFSAVYGIDVYMARDVEVRENVASFGEFAGINLLNVERVLIGGNNVSSNNVLGIALDFATDVTIGGNDLWDNDYGLDVLDSGNVIVRGNTIGTDTSDGVTVSSSSNVTFDSNTFIANAGGLYAFLVTDMAVVHNAFEGNYLQAGDDSGTRTAWDGGYPAGGNYWSDYFGVDDCSGPDQDVCGDPDGIGDTPYVVDADTLDRYPLMSPRGPDVAPRPGPGPATTLGFRTDIPPPLAPAEVLVPIRGLSTAEPSGKAARP